MKSLVRWVGRYILLLILLVVAGLGYSSMTSRYGPIWEWPDRIMRDVRQLEDASRILAGEVERLKAASRTKLEDKELQSIAIVTARQRAVTQELARRHAEDRTSGNIATQLLTGGEQQVLRVNRNRLSIRALEIEYAFLDKIRQPATTLAQLTDWQRSATRSFARLRNQCRTLNAEADRLEHDWIWRRYRADTFGIHNKVKELRARAASDCKSASGLQRKYVQVQGERRQLAAKIHNLPTPADAYAGVLDELNKALRERWQTSARLWLQSHHAGTVMRAAIVGVILAMLMPFVIRIVFFWLLAPIAARRSPIRLLPDSAAMTSNHERSAVSLDVGVPVGWELLVKQGYLHRAPIGARPSTQWLLSNRQPVASVIRKLAFLTRYREVPDGAQATISVGNEPFAEVALLRLAVGTGMYASATFDRGSATARCSTYADNRALAALLDPGMAFLAIAISCFHGPAELVLKGARGLHMIAAEHDIELPAEHVVGFSANLSYGVIRAATFQPYLFGREALLRDAIRRGPGMVITEKAPGLAGRGSHHGPSHRLENSLDVVLKFFGL